MGVKITEKNYAIDNSTMLVVKEYGERTKKTKKLKKKWIFSIKNNRIKEVQRIPNFAVVDILVIFMSFDKEKAREQALRKGIPEERIAVLMKRREDEIQQFADCFKEFSQSSKEMQLIADSSIIGAAYFLKNPIEERNLGDLINLVTLGYKGCAMLFNCFEEAARPILTEKILYSQITETSKRALDCFEEKILPILKSGKTNKLLEVYKEAENKIEDGNKESQEHHSYVNATDYLIARSSLHFEVPIESIFKLKREIVEFLQCEKECEEDCKNCHSKGVNSLISKMNLNVIKQSCLLTFSVDKSTSAAVIKCARFENELFIVYEVHFAEFTETVYELKVNLRHKTIEQVTILGEELLEDSVFNKLLLQPSVIVGLLVLVNHKFQTRMSEKDESPDTLNTMTFKKSERDEVSNTFSTIKSEMSEKDRISNTLREVIRVSIDDTHLSDCKVKRIHKGTSHSHHRSPIMHWRRGHWRKTSKGQTFIRGQWINEQKNVNSVIFVSKKV